MSGAGLGIFNSRFSSTPSSLADFQDLEFFDITNEVVFNRHHLWFDILVDQLFGFCILHQAKSAAWCTVVKL